MSSAASVVKCPVCGASHLPQKGQLNDGVYACSCENCGFFFKFRATQPTASSVTFTVNGETYSVGNEWDPATSLNEYLRKTGVSRGTKQMCIEGGCGVCLVTATLFEPISGTKKVYAINSCLAQLYMCDGWEITTTEGIGSPSTKLHPVQERLAQYNGSQCGFCSPAQVMHMYGLLQRNPKPTKKDIEDAYDTSICRCTGYRPILDAMKSFAVDTPGGTIDIEDLQPKLCQKSGQPCTGRCSQDKADGEKKDRVGRSVHIVGARAQWFKPSTLPELYQLLKQYRDANYRLVFGNSGFGVYKELGPWMYDILIDIRGISALYNIDFGTTIILGAGLTLGNLQELFEQRAGDPTVKSYFPVLASHLKMVATTSVRNVAGWAGSLMLKHKHPDFVSDVYTMFETVGVRLFIVDDEARESKMTLTDFLKLDMKGKVIIAAEFPKYSGEDKTIHINTYRVSQRLQNSHGYVTAGFNFRLDSSQNYTITQRPSLVFQGISANFNHASKTETYLQGKQLADPQVLREAMSILHNELNPSSDPVLASPEYRRNLACALFYKFVLSVTPDKVSQRYQSGATQLVRPVSSGVQTYDTDKMVWPVNEPMTKLDAVYQTSGVCRYVDDLPLADGELHAAFVISTVGNARIQSVDPSAALAMPGVHRCIQAKDLPLGGENNFMPLFVFRTPEEILSSGQILYAGQPIAIIVADDPLTATTAAEMVKVTYTDVQRPLTDIKEAVDKKSFFPDTTETKIAGNPDEAIKNSPVRVTGTIEIGTQYHHYMETQITRCVPGDDGGMEVQAATQWPDGVASIVAGVLGIPLNSVTVEVKRVGGAFGGKITRNLPVVGACAWAAGLMNRPVRMRLDLHTNIKSNGKRPPQIMYYEVGTTKEGKLNGLRLTTYADAGYNKNDVFSLLSAIDNAYFCENWKVTSVFVKTNTASNSAVRAPVKLPAVFLIESVMEHVAKYLNMDPTECRLLNLYQKGQKTPWGAELPYCNIRDIVSQLETSSDYAARKQEVAAFNKANRWKKRGLSMVPVRYGISWTSSNFSVLVSICHEDGSIVVQHGGVEIGQGINTKAAQVCAYELGVPLSLVRVKKTTTNTNSNSGITGSSVTSGQNCVGVIQCCQLLKSRMEPVRKKMNNPTWQELVTQCYKENVDLTAQISTNPKADAGGTTYNVYAATISEAELDVLTGQSQINRVDILYDCGRSLNPEVDIGQVEGGFVLALGYHLTEKIKYDPDTGVILTDGTWTYKPPLPKDIPIDFRISLLKNAPNPLGVLQSKTTGEPSCCMASSALFAIKHAAEAARAEIGQDKFFAMNSPALVEDVQTACLVDPSQFTLGQ